MKCQECEVEFDQARDGRCPACHALVGGAELPSPDISQVNLPPAVNDGDASTSDGAEPDEQENAVGATGDVLDDGQSGQVPPHVTPTSNSGQGGGRGTG